MSRHDRFREANRLWFDEGRTKQAIEAYLGLLDEDPDDPVVLYQLSRIRWAMGAVPDARTLAQRANLNRRRLEQRGAERLDWWLKQLSFDPEAFSFPELAVAELDMDVLERLDPASVPWAEVALAADQRGMVGLAAIASDRGLGTFADGEDFRDLDALERKAALERRLLEKMSPSGGGPSSEGTYPEHELAPDEVVTEEIAVNTGAADDALAGVDGRAELPSLDDVIHLDARVVPAISSMRAPVQLLLRLENSTDTPLLVNARMLFVAPEASPLCGEITAQVHGPAGYANDVAFTIRSGAPSPHDFIEVGPGGVIERAFPLSRYERLDVAGDYELQVTYRNVVPQRVGHLVALVGAATTTCAFTRAS
jgi:hypothetical protein